MKRKLLITGSFLGLIAILLGAFGAHGLKESLSETAINSFETGVRYQMYHAFLLLITGSALSLPSKSLKIILYLVSSGVLFFSGSIYLLATKPLTGIDISTIAWITPIGGALLISAWILVLYNFIKSSK